MIPAIGIRMYEGRVRVVIRFLHHCWELQRHGGLKYLVITLKAAYVVLQQSLGGQRLDDLTPLGVRFSRTKGRGYPRMIPVLDRKRMAAGDMAVMRF
jgi:hypothetical protein